MRIYVEETIANKVNELEIREKYKSTDTFDDLLDILKNVSTHKNKVKLSILRREIHSNGVTVFNHD